MTFKPIKPSAENVRYALFATTSDNVASCTLTLGKFMRHVGRGKGSGSIPKRICELKQAGYPITAVGWHTHHGTRYRTYRLEEQ